MFTRITRLHASAVQYAKNVRPIYVVVVALGLVGQVALMRIGAFDLLYEYTRAHEHYELDEWLSLFAVLTVVFLAFLIIRASDLKREVAQRIAAEETANRLARHDPLTGVANRRLFNEELTRRIDAAAAKGERLAVLFLDLDRFKVINDTEGHDWGDRVLRITADRVRATIRPQDFVARLGGDEFAALVRVSNEEDIIRLAERFLIAIEAPIGWQGKEVAITASLGIAVYPTDGAAADVLLQRADIAMYQAKAAGRNTHAFFDPVMDHALHERRILEQELKEAISSDQIIPHYQPVIALETGKIVGFEALARWQHPTRGLLPPDQFIPLAEDSRLIGELFGRVLRRACEDARSWGPEIYLAVNVSPMQLSDGGLPQEVMGILQEQKFPPQRLELEITESAVLDNAHAKLILPLLKQHGIRISLDDFGTGYSSLSNLQELPFDRIKIDRSFLLKQNGSQNLRIIDAVISLSHSLGLMTVAEGIETSQDATWLARKHCEFGQGYYFSQPIPACDVNALLQSGCLLGRETKATAAITLPSGSSRVAV